MAGTGALGLSSSLATEEWMNTRTYFRPLAALAVGAMFLLVAACGAEAPAAQPEQAPEPAPAAVETAPSATAAPPAPAVAASQPKSAEPMSAAEAAAASGEPSAPQPTVPAAALPDGSDTAGVVLEGSLTQPTDTPAAGMTPAGTDLAEQPTEPPPPTAIPVVEPPPDVPVGKKVGNRVPEFALELVDGSTVTSAELQAQGQPVFLFFTATF